MRPIAIHTSFTSTGAGNDREAKAYFRALAKDLPWVKGILELVHDMFRDSDGKQQPEEWQYEAEVVPDVDDEWLMGNIGTHAYYEYGQPMRLKSYRNKILR